MSVLIAGVYHEQVNLGFLHVKYDALRPKEDYERLKVPGAGV